VLFPRESVNAHLWPSWTIYPAVIHRLPNLDSRRQQAMIHIAIKMTQQRGGFLRLQAGHGGEICFAVEASLPWHHLRHHATARERALAVFSEMRVWDTEHNNGVLIYLNLADRGVEIVADRGIARPVPAAAWDAICHALKARCAAGAYGPGVIEAVLAVGELLRTHFPLAPGAVRVNEIPDAPLVR